MGTWSHQPFGNDDACDWAYDLAEQSGWALVDEAMLRVLAEGETYLDAETAVHAVAAAEVVAKARGRGTQADAYTEVVDAWVAQAPAPDGELLATARAALARIVGPHSELRELWEESNHYDEWIASMEALQHSVSADPA